MTPAFVAGAVRGVIDDDTGVLNEAITSAPAIDRHLPRTKPGTLFYSGGSSLGWHGGAAVGMKLAAPEKDVVALVGDGTYVFSCPTAVYWMARRYNAPFMTVIFNNQGWNAPRMITRGEHPDGYAARGQPFWTSFDPVRSTRCRGRGRRVCRTVSDPAPSEKPPGGPRGLERHPGGDQRPAGPCLRLLRSPCPTHIAIYSL
jgi:acetolactate synthase-1/2/3 large subunit